MITKAFLGGHTHWLHKGHKIIGNRDLDLGRSEILRSHSMVTACICLKFMINNGNELRSFSTGGVTFHPGQLKRQESPPTQNHVARETQNRAFFSQRRQHYKSNTLNSWWIIKKRAVRQLKKKRETPRFFSRHRKHSSCFGG